MLLPGQQPAEQPIQPAKRRTVKIIQGDNEADRNQKIGLEHYEARANVGLEKRNNKIADMIGFQRVQAAKRLKGDHGLALEDGRIEVAKEIGRAGSRDYKSVVGGVNKTFEEVTAAWIASSAQSISGILAFIDRNLDAARGTQGAVGNLDLLSAMAQGQSEQFAGQTDLNKVVYDSVGLLNSLASSQMLYGAGGAYAGAALTAGYFGAQQAGTDMLRMEGMFDKQTGKALATPSQILRRGWATVAVQGGLEAAGAALVSGAVKGAQRLPGGSKSIEKATDYISGTLQKYAGRSKEIADYAARMTGAAAESGIAEGLTEFLQNAASDATVNTIDPSTDLIDAVSWSDAFYAAALGAISGGVLGSIHSASKVAEAQRQEYASQLPEYKSVYGQSANLDPNITPDDVELSRSFEILNDPEASIPAKEAALGHVFGEYKGEMVNRFREQSHAREKAIRDEAVAARTVVEQAKGSNFEQTDPVTYLQAREANTRKDTLSNYTADELNNSAIIKRPGTETYFLLRPSTDEKGKTTVDLAGLFNNDAEGGAIPWAIDTALAVTPPDVPLTLDAFAGHLDKKYAAQGFVEHSRVPFDPKFATPEMIASLQKESHYLETGKMPDVVFMHHKDRPWNGVQPEVDDDAARRKAADDAELATWGDAALSRYDRQAEDTFSDFIPAAPAVAPNTQKGKPKSAKTLLREKQQLLINQAIRGVQENPAHTGLGFSIGGPSYDSLMVSNRDIGIMESYNLMHARPLYIFERLQGDNPRGWATNIFHDPFVAANAEYQRRMYSKSGLRGKYRHLIDQFGGEISFSQEMFERRIRDGDPERSEGFTGQERVGIALASMDKDARALLLEKGFINQAGEDGKALTEAELNSIVNGLTEHEADVVAKLQAFWGQQHPRLVDVAAGLGIDIGRIYNYYPITGEVEHTGTDKAKSKRPGQMVGVKGISDSVVAEAEDFFIKTREHGKNRRLNISALDVWQSQGAAAEYWMTHALPLSNAMSVMNDGRFRDVMNANYGKAKSREPEFGQTSVLQILDQQMEDIARNSTANTSMGESWLATARHHAGPALLGLKMSVILKQPLSYSTGIFEYAAMGNSTGESTTAIMAKALKNSPANIFRAAKYEYQSRDPNYKPDRVNKLLDEVPAIEERKTGRGIDPLIDDMIEVVRDKGAEQKQGYVSIQGRQVKRSIVQLSMKGIVMMDRMTLRSMADFIIRNELKGGATEEQAKYAAQRAIEKTQPMSGNLYLPMAYRSGELVRSMTLFTGEINQFGNLAQQQIRRMVGPKAKLDDFEAGLWLLLVMGFNTYGTSIIDSAGRATDPRKEYSQDFYKMNTGRFAGMAGGGIFGGMIASAAVNHLYYDGVWSDTPSPPILSSTGGVTGKSIKAWKKPEDTQIKALAKELVSAGGMAMGLPLAGAWNLVQGLSDAISSGELDLNTLSAAAGFSRFSRGVASSSKTGKPAEKKK